MKPKFLGLLEATWLVATSLVVAAPARAGGRILLTNRGSKARTSRAKRTGKRSRRQAAARRRRPWSMRHHLRRRHQPGRPYAGIVPGTSAEPPGPRPPAGRCWLTWPGFQLTNQGSRVFFQLNRQVVQSIQSRKRGFDILFPGCRIRLKNNRHRLVTAYFPSTPVFDISTRNTKNGAVARIRLKTSVNPRIHWLTKNGWAYLLVDFGPYADGHLRIRRSGATLRARTSRRAKQPAR